VDVSVAEGDPVKTGDVLFRLDDSLLQAQRKAASAALDSARAGVQTAKVAVEAAQLQYELSLSNALAGEQPDRTDAWKQAKPANFDQPGWYFSKEERLRSTQAAVEEARKALEEAQASLANVKEKVGSAQFLDAEQRLSTARIAYQIAQQVLDQTNGTTDGQELHDAAQNAFDDAKTELDSAQRAYDDALTTAGAQDVLEARAKAAVAQERYAATLDALRALQTGADSPLVTAAAKLVEQAKTALAQAQAAVAQVQAELDLIDAQIEKLAVRAPLDSVVLTRSIQPGEVIQAGATALTIGKLDVLKVTVYIPENRYGEIERGDQATLRVDSFPGESFTAVVTRISDQAEFTPQNVQTNEQRQTTVYAVQLTIENVAGKLKPGMPVDVTFASQVSSQ